MGSHRHLLHRRLLWQTSRLTLLDARWTEQQGKTARFRVELGTFRKLPPSSLPTPFLLAMAPRARTPSSWHPRLTHPSSLGIPSNHTLQPPFLSYHLRPGSGLRLVTAAIPLSYTRGFSRPQLLLFTRAQGSRQPLAHPRLYRVMPAASEPKPSLPIFAGHIPVPIPYLFFGRRADNPRPFFLIPHPHN